MADLFDAARPVDDRYTPPPCGELDEIAAVFDDGRLSGGAAVLAAYEQALAGWFGVSRAVAVNSGSSALHATLVALGVTPGTEVIVPATAPAIQPSVSGTALTRPPTSGAAYRARRAPRPRRRRETWCRQSPGTSRAPCPR